MKGKIITIMFLIVCMSVSYSQEIKKITLQKSVKTAVETNFCQTKANLEDGHKMGILIFYSTIENLNFEIVYPRTAIKNVTHQKENSRYVLCVEPTNEQNSSYRIKIYAAGYETTYHAIDELSPKEQLVFEITEKKDKKTLLAENRAKEPFYYKHRNNYVNWGILDVSAYPFHFGTSVYGRGGNTIGIGGEISIGLALLTVENNGRDNDFIDDVKITYGTLTYSGKVRFYYYKNLFIQSGFGALGLVDIKPTMDYEKLYYIEKGGAYIKYGIPVQLGYDWIWGENELRKGGYGTSGGSISLRAGIGYDVNLKDIVPQVEISIGYKFGYKKL